MGSEWDSQQPPNRKKGTLVCADGVTRVPEERGGSQAFGRGRKENSAVSRAAPMLEQMLLLLLLLLHDFFDPGQVVGDAGVDAGRAVVPEGNDALRHLLAYQGPARISLRIDERLVLEVSSLWEQVSWSVPAQAPPAGPCLCSGSAAAPAPCVHPGAPGAALDRGFRAPRELVLTGATNQMLVTSPGNQPSLCQQRPLLWEPASPRPSPQPIAAPTWLESLSSWKLPAHTMPVLRCG